MSKKKKLKLRKKGNKKLNVINSVFIIPVILTVLGVILFFTFIILNESNFFNRRVPEINVGETTVLKKGIGGPATIRTLNGLKVGWFYNWHWNPAYDVNYYDRWNGEIWDKFVPLFSPWQNMDTSFASSAINEICSKTSYCNKGGYYLIGNEPDHPGIGEQERMGGTIEEAAEISVRRHGEIIKRILAKDPTARFIMVGFYQRDDVFIDRYISYWKQYWVNDSVIAVLPSIIKGWQIHNYGSYKEVPSDDSYIRGALAFIDSKMVNVFGKKVNKQEVWVTEMGTLGKYVPNPNTQPVEFEKFKERMKGLVKVYDNSDIVTRYAWFYHGCIDAIVSGTTMKNNCLENYSYSLFNKLDWRLVGNAMYDKYDGYQISSLGSLYASLGGKTVFVGGSGGETFLLNEVITAPTAQPVVVNLISTPTLRPTPILTPKPTPTPNVLKCESKCSYGSYQCSRDNTGLTGGKCMINPKCSAYKPGVTEWVWSYCYP